VEGDELELLIGRRKTRLTILLDSLDELLPGSLVSFRESRVGEHEDLLREGEVGNGKGSFFICRCRHLEESFGGELRRKSFEEVVKVEEKVEKSREGGRRG